ncbi:MAG: hypothetical protein KDA27_10825 [Candidatus Eisenbacteria bacterium]|uniref:Lipoprotein n=1 Tax=Eiseniibacteriota bacterium TaxID=2212470 RepID=A0A956NG18_UNCEI|nr:hypothetical protein [Candidatus Eisenbacteria bacterium]MCB9463322.1 hypothetical protein [Candidatus Eisenbacteria bacterium]
MKNSLRSFAWFAGLALLVQGLAACSNSNSPLAPTGQDDASIQRVDVVHDGTGGGGSPVDIGGEVQDDAHGDGRGDTPSAPDATDETGN